MPRRRDSTCCSRSCNQLRLNREYADAKRHPPAFHVCSSCNGFFAPVRPFQKYCSVNCGARGRYKTAALDPRSCAFCGQTFAPKRADSVVCSRVCSRRVTYHQHREQRVADAVAWARANREARSAITNQYKAKRRQLEGPSNDNVGVTSKDWIRLVRRYGSCCAYCGTRGPVQMEHVIPLARGGRHAIGNVLPACASCNLSKQTAFVSEWKRRQTRVARITRAA